MADSRSSLADSVLVNIRVFLIVFALSLVAACAGQQDRGVARLAAGRIHSQMLSGDFGAIYNESADGFKTIDASEFISMMTTMQDKLGRIKNIKELAYQTGLDSRVGRTHTLIFDIEYDSGRVKETLVLIYADRHTMQLWKLGIEPRP